MLKVSARFFFFLFIATLFIQQQFETMYVKKDAKDVKVHVSMWSVLFLFSFFLCVYLDMTGATIPVPQSDGSCGVKLVAEKKQSLSFFSRYDSCYAKIEVKCS